MDKKTLRREYENRRQSLTATQRLEAGAKLLTNVQGLPEVQAAKRLASFVSFRSEIATEALHQWLLDNGKKLALPKVFLDKRLMVFYWVDDLSTLVKGPYGIYEPDETRHPVASPEQFDVIFSPGLAFDQHGYRLGYGGGYYDKLFSTEGVDAARIGLAFAIQLTDRLVVEAYDQPLNLVVTEEGVTEF